MRVFAVNRVQPETAAGKPSKPRGSHAQLSVALIPLTLVFLALTASSALAVTGGPQWTVTAVSAPTNLVPGDESGDQFYNVIVTNTGGEPSSGTVTITDTLPAGVTLDQAGAEGFELVSTLVGDEADSAGTPLSCEGLSCTFSEPVAPENALLLKIPVDVEPASEREVANVVHVSGGGAPDAFMRTPTLISSNKAGYAIAPGSATVSLSDSQAGAHADLTSTIGYDTVNGEGKDAGDQKEASLTLPPGFGGDLVDTPQCEVAKLAAAKCPIGTQVGVATIFFEGPLGHDVRSAPVYNLQPEPGDVAKLGFEPVPGINVQADVTVLPGTYQLKTTFHNINADLQQNLVSITIWGVPTEPAHDHWRWEGTGTVGEGHFGFSSSNARVPYLSSPTSCSGEAALPATYSSVSWQEPAAQPAAATALLAPLNDCDRLGLESTFTAVPTTTSASAATGLNVELGVHQTNENPEGLAASALKKAVVTLPEGMTVNPSAGAGLGSCTREEYEAEALVEDPETGCPIESKLGTVKIVTPALEEEAKGSVYLATPYANPFPEPARAGEPAHPEGSLLALYVVARFPVRGVLVKVAGKVEANPVTGQLVTSFEGVPSLHGPYLEGLPPVPFSLFTFQFHQGQTSPLITPPACGSYDVSAALNPWSEPSQLLSDISPAFEISSGAGDGPCPSGGTPPFAPGVTAGTENNDAGSYSPLDIRIARNDGEQEITGFASLLPPGLTGNLSGIPFCGEAEVQRAREQSGVQAETSSACPAGSEIGHSVADAGVGSVLAQAPGKLYLGGPFEGAPFSIVSITSAKVGPFDLGTVVVHLPLDINPETAQVSIPSGPADQIPHIIKGIVVHIREIRVFVNRGDFMLNPTSCEPFDFSATVIGGGAEPANPADNDPVTVTTPFRVTACQALKFAPKFVVTTSGKTSKADGASLHVNLTYPTGALGQDSNIKQVKVDLPKQLPSRLTTLQKACTAAQFASNPAGCPAASLIGTAKAVTPIIPVPLEGPAYFVSHGGEAFPELEIVLQGYGVKIVLTGDTFISKSGITSSTFKTVPDQPVTSFELTLPEGPYSALAANGNLCAATKTVTVKTKVDKRVKGKLVRRNGKLVKVVKKTTKTVAESLQMPTEFVAQNGATIHQTTPVSVTSCPKAKPAKKARKAKAKRKHTK